MNPIWQLRMMKFSGSSPPCSFGEGQQQNYGSSQLPKPAAKALFWQHVTICQKSMISLTGKKLIYRIVLWDEGTKQESIPLNPFPLKVSYLLCFSETSLYLYRGDEMTLSVSLIFWNENLCRFNFYPYWPTSQRVLQWEAIWSFTSAMKKASYGNLRGFKMLPSYVGILS